MPATDFDPTDLVHLDDPWTRYRELRDVAPVVELRSGGTGVFGYAEAEVVLRERRFASSPIALAYASALPEGALRDEMTNRINFLDPPDHPRVRGLVSKVFTPRRMEALQPWIAATADELLDALPIERGRVELMDGFAHQLPSLVISELLGVPVADRDRLTALSDRVTPIFGTRVDPDDKAGAVEAAEEMHAYFRDLFERRRSEPRDDVLTALVHAEEDGDRLRMPELLSLVATLYSAGHRTTRDLVGNGIDAVLRHGLRLGDHDPAALVEELLRVATPTHFVARVPLEDTDVLGTPVAAWTPIYIFLAAANRDPRRFDAPDELRPGRGGPAPLSFAFGAHFCLGASLARLEAREMVGAVARRFPDSTIGTDRPAWHQRGPFRGLDELVLVTGRR